LGLQWCGDIQGPGPCKTAEDSPQERTSPISAVSVTPQPTAPSSRAGMQHGVGFDCAEAQVLRGILT
jgi:hypothetical protein